MHDNKNDINSKNRQNKIDNIAKETLFNNRYSFFGKIIAKIARKELYLQSDINNRTNYDNSSRLRNNKMRLGYR